MLIKTENTSTYQLDLVDITILQELQKNARLTLKELSQKANLSTTPVYERWRRLEQLGYIKNYVTVLDAEKLHQTFTVYCMVKLQRLDHATAVNFVNSVVNLPEVTECYNISGDYDYMLKIMVSNMKTYREFVLNVLGHIEAIGSVTSYFVMDEIKQSFEVPLM